MNDLIRKSDVLKLPRYNFGVSMLTSEEYIKVSDIKKILTAYDIDKVVEELEKELEKGNIAIDFGEFRLFEIVKQGGATKRCNNCANYTEPDEVDNGCYLCCKGYEDNYEPKVDNGGVGKDVEQMKATGIVRRFDFLGRIVIPKEIRKQLFGTFETECIPMEIFMDGDDIILRKYEETVSDDVCVWERGKPNDDWKPSCDPKSTYNVFGVAWFRHCPYCGKKILCKDV